jgi:hypothetical protein
MYTGDRRAEDARQALELVRARPELARVLIDNYDGDGSALEALTQLVAELTPHERSTQEIADERARQKALFGPPMPESDEAVAREQRRASRSESLDRAVSPVLRAAREEQPTADAGADLAVTPSERQSEPQLRPRPRLPIVVALVASFVLGLLIAGGLARYAPPRAMATPPPTALPSVAAQVGYPADALTWFTGTKASGPPFPYPGDLRTLGVVPDTIRFIETDQSDSTLWIGRTTQNLCLIWTGTTQQGPSAETTCGTPSAFAHAALTISTKGMLYSWNGRTITVTLLPTP